MDENRFETEMERMYEEMTQMFNRMRSTPFSPFSNDETSVDFDLIEQEDRYVLTADLPGFERDEIDLRFNEGALIISAEHVVTEETDDSFSFRNRTCYESITLPKEIVAEEITAEYRNGVLEVHLPVVKESSGNRIDIN